MPIERRIVRVGSSRAVTIPSSWIELLEKKHKAKVEGVAMEINTAIIIKPIIRGKVIEG